jgi:hypothetical protein
MAFRLRWITLVERSRSNFALFISVLCTGFFLSLFPGVAIGDSQWEVQTLSVEIHAEVRHWCSVPKKVFISRAR